MCLYCGVRATAIDHIIPRCISDFFSAPWNTAPACKSCNSRKRDFIAIDYIVTPGKNYIEDAAVWAVIYNVLEGTDSERDLIDNRAALDFEKWRDAVADEAWAIYQVLTHRGGERRIFAIPLPLEVLLSNHFPRKRSFLNGSRIYGTRSLSYRRTTIYLQEKDLANLRRVLTLRRITFSQWVRQKVIEALSANAGENPDGHDSRTT